VSLLGELKRRNVLRVGAAYIVAAWLVIQVVETILPAFGFGDTAVRITTIVFAIGFLPTLVFSWVFELTPEGLKKDSEVDRSKSIARETGKKLDGIFMIALSLAVGYFAFDKFVLDPRRDAEQTAQMDKEIAEAIEQGRSEALLDNQGKTSIAVLPFVNMSADREQEFFSDGISEELLNLLARIPELRVISRTSSFHYKGKNIRVSQVAEDLNVTHVLEGSVRKAGNKVRITAQLIEARSDTHLWSETYDRTLDDIFVIQDEISATVVDKLKISLLGEAPRAEETVPAAYALYLQARHLAAQRNKESLALSNELFEQALAIDPSYAPALTELAGNYTYMVISGLVSAEEGYGRAKSFTEQALLSNSAFAPAHTMLGWLAMYQSHDLVEAARHYSRALEIDPTNSGTIAGAATLLLSVGRLDAAIPLLEYNTARSPVSPIAHNNLGYNYLYAGRLDAAIDAFETTLRLSPDFISTHYGMGAAFLLAGDYDRALEEMQLETYEPYRLIGLALVDAAIGATEQADAVLDTLIADHETGFAYNIAYIYAYRGEVDSAFEWLARAVEHGDSGLSDIVVQPFFESVRDDPRWLPFLRSIGKAPDQLDRVEFSPQLRTDLRAGIGKGQSGPRFAVLGPAGTAATPATAAVRVE